MFVWGLRLCLVVECDEVCVCVQGLRRGGLCGCVW